MKPKNKKPEHATDSRNWKVVTFQGKELVLAKNVFNKETNVNETIYVTRYDSYLTANHAAKLLSGVAVRE